MSLILDALKKLEREKQTSPRGFLVVAPGTWAGTGRGAVFIGAALAIGLVLGALGLAAYGRWRAPAAAPLAGGIAPVTQVPETARSQAPTVRAETPEAPLLPPTGTALLRPRVGALTDPASPNPASPTSRRRAAVQGVPSQAAPEPSPARPAGPQLQAISLQDGRPVAVIDERIVREGDVIEGMTIVRIGAAEVEIELAGRRRILRF